MKYLLFLLMLYGTTAALTKDDVTALLRRHDFTQSHLGFVVQELSADTSYIAVNADSWFTPASLQKIFTGAAAFDILGKEHRFPTHVYIDSLDTEKGMTLGTSRFVGTGDPHLTAENLWLFATQLANRGIREITDTLILDHSLFGSEIYGPGFENKNSSRAYMAPASSLSANFNALEIHIAPTTAGNDAHVALLPPRDDVRIRGRIVTQTEGSPRLEVTTYEDAGETILFLNGVISETSPHRVFYRKIWDPQTHFHNALSHMLNTAGITLSAVVKTTTTPHPQDTTRTPFYTHHSPPLSFHVGNTLQFSNNFIAENLYRAAVEPKTGPVSWNEASQRMTDWYIHHIDSTDTPPHFVNGSGMGRENRTTPLQLLRTLQYVYEQPEWKYEFISGLPVAGINGTLATRLDSPPLRGTVRAKTGTLAQSGVNNLAGYVYIDNRTYAFTLILNNRHRGAYAHWNLQEELLELLVKNLTEKNAPDYSDEESR
ncbi:D-alanyl-D-alanine carboxypeptidase/D-alanyl-D-alanine endopeptidase [Chitinivibrio alkaliphilus]|uniref:D-alanyl-D-alanine carboxypeptidase/D-alanyl-D-alanine-endopeptidase n=1 Tax=Chitinivibrio alkaliphilus ACht1 TaxID=1313304 RepID=U7D949_9BACT|nr:D-alanyl-D-alanine carboxypeptidase/D-alanyl-D-alanine-endopeptidase [Chitinivibrio alkaliphilus]ERP31622.1 D-alanyl-D-alanine carboxypeptidase/D-alanyl-D-alanine-endopeptidase [Chitinivibrio alkaliphilus ACht1]